MDHLVNRNLVQESSMRRAAHLRNRLSQGQRGDLDSNALMVPGDSGGEQTPVAAGLDSDSAEWLRVLAGTGPQREAALARLHEMLVRIARGEARRRGPRLEVAGPELDDLAYQAAADALMSITGKLGQFRGESRFTTWVYKFVIFEVSAKIGRHEPLDGPGQADQRKEHLD
jgi:hypothetical protein